MRQTIDWVAEAVQSLHAAAAHAERLGQADVFSSWAAMADQIRLVAAGLDPVAPHAVTSPWPTVSDALTAALEALDQVTALDGPTDLALWQWHIREVRDLTDRLEAHP